MLSEHVLQAVLEHKVRRRLWEYVVLLAVQGFFVGAFTPVVTVEVALPIGILTAGAGMALAWIREQRRLLGNPYQRLWLDASEIFLLLLVLGISALVASGFGLSLVVYQGHLSYVLFGYVLGSLLGEVGWRRRVFRQLPAEERYRYVQNLAPSLVFPYSVGHLRRLWRRWQQPKRQ